MRRVSLPAAIDDHLRFVEATGNPAMIGRLDQAAQLVRGECGTVIESVETADPRAAPAPRIGHLTRKAREGS